MLCSIPFKTENYLWQHWKDLTCSGSETSYVIQETQLFSLKTNWQL